MATVGQVCRFMNASASLIEAAELFTQGADDAVRALNAAGLACPASLALAAERARNALADLSAEERA